MSALFHSYLCGRIAAEWLINMAENEIKKINGRTLCDSTARSDILAQKKKIENLEHNGSGSAGEDGFSPIASVNQTANGAVITVTDKNGTTTAVISNGTDGKNGIDGKDGQQGVPGTPGIDGRDGQNGADGQDGKDGISVTHSWNGTVLTITSASGTSSADLKGEKGEQGTQGIPGIDGLDGKNGNDGKDGTNGKDGISVTHSWDGTVLTVTSASGTTATDLKGEKGEQGIQGKSGVDGKDGVNGKDGNDGSPGVDGYTPIKGTDYWTPSDKAEIISELGSTITPDSIGAATEKEFEQLSIIIQEETAARENAITELKTEGVQQTPVYAESVDWLNENGDTALIYLLPDGYLYAYKYVTIGNELYVSSEAEINVRHSHSSAAVISASGYVLTGYIDISETMKRTDPKLKILFATNKKSTARVTYYDADKNYLNTSSGGNYNAGGAFDSEWADDYTCTLHLGKENGTKCSYFPNIAYVRIEAIVNNAC